MSFKINITTFLQHWDNLNSRQDPFILYLTSTITKLWKYKEVPVDVY